MEKENWPELTALTSGFSVELPGIEPATEIPLTWTNTESKYAKRREMTCGYASGVDGINSTVPLFVGTAAMLQRVTARARTCSVIHR